MVLKIEKPRNVRICQECHLVSSWSAASAHIYPEIARVPVRQGLDVWIGAEASAYRLLLTGKNPNSHQTVKFTSRWTHPPMLSAVFLTGMSKVKVVEMPLRATRTRQVRIAIFADCMDLRQHCALCSAVLDLNENCAI